MADIFSKLEKEPVSAGDDKASFTSSNVFVGDLGSGKSTLIQSFLKPTASKDSKPTIALDFNFARRVKDGVKSVANIWEVGGDVESKLVEIGVNNKLFTSSSVFIVVDLSKPQNVLSSLLRSISAVKEVVATRVAELQASNVNALNELRSRLSEVLKGHPDATKMRPIEVPIFIVANKFDAFKNLPSSDRRAIMQVLRFVAHYHCATLISVSASDSHMKDAFRALVGAVCFNGPTKVAYEANADKFVYISRGADNFQNILLGDGAQGAGQEGKRLISQESDVDLYMKERGVTRDCFRRMLAHMVSLFGEADVPSSAGSDSSKQRRGVEGEDVVDDGSNSIADDSASSANTHPESEIDATRALRDAALQRYIQEAERKEQMLNKMNARSNGDRNGDGDGKDNEA